MYNSWEVEIQIGNGYSIFLEAIGADGYRTVYRYELAKDGKAIFEGKDFSPASRKEIDFIDIAVDLLGFLTLKEGDTDDEYFEGYTPEQRAWTESNDCEDFGMIVFDHENEDSEHYARAEFKVIDITA